MNGGLVAVDLIWLFTVAGSWNSKVKNNQVWEGLSGIHHFVIFWSVINLFLKV